jgi:hypothetical protein
LPLSEGAHALAAELLPEYLGLLLVGEQEDLEEPAFARYRVPVTRQRQPALVAKGPCISFKFIKLFESRRIEVSSLSARLVL